MWPLWIAALLFSITLGLIGGQPAPALAESDDADTLFLPRVVLPYIVVLRESAPPVITSTPITTAVVGLPYTYTVQASGNPAPAFSLESAPQGMTIDADSGLIQWTPAETGSYTVAVRAANGIGPDAQQTYAIQVAPDGSQLPERIWDPRLDQRGATLVEASPAPGQGYWRLVEARWLDEAEADACGPDHHILMDVLDDTGERVVGLPIRIGWFGDYATVYTQAKPGELAAADYPMVHVAPTYNARPNDGAPADRVDGLGLGSIEAPGQTIHTGYILIWRWTIAPR
jgi:hypothetical protein